MLVLARKKGQSIVVNDNIELVVVDVQKDVVRLGIKAPQNVTIFRKEIYEEIMEENKKAVSAKKVNLSGIIKQSKGQNE
jgi:carbon storage regulator